MCITLAVYQCAVYDPEGTLGSITATVMTFLGLQAGRVIVHYKNHSHKAMLTRWAVWGLSLCLLATALCGGSQVLLGPVWQAKRMNETTAAP